MPLNNLRYIIKCQQNAFRAGRCLRSSGFRTYPRPAFVDGSSRRLEGWRHSTPAASSCFCRLVLDVDIVDRGQWCFGRAEVGDGNVCRGVGIGGWAVPIRRRSLRRRGRRHRHGTFTFARRRGRQSISMNPQKFGYKVPQDGGMGHQSLRRLRHPPAHPRPKNPGSARGTNWEEAALLSRVEAATHHMSDLLRLQESLLPPPLWIYGPGTIKPNSDEEVEEWQEDDDAKTAELRRVLVAEAFRHRSHH